MMCRFWTIPPSPHRTSGRVCWITAPRWYRSGLRRRYRTLRNAGFDRYDARFMVIDLVTIGTNCMVPDDFGRIRHETR